MSKNAKSIPIFNESTLWQIKYQWQILSALAVFTENRANIIVRIPRIIFIWKIANFLFKWWKKYIQFSEWFCGAAWTNSRCIEAITVFQDEHIDWMLAAICAWWRPDRCAFDWFCKSNLFDNWWYSNRRWHRKYDIHFQKHDTLWQSLMNVLKLSIIVRLQLISFYEASCRFFCISIFCCSNHCGLSLLVT